ncbi:MAG: peptidylprolyl isomerase [Planctomycetota bacterium]
MITTLLAFVPALGAPVAEDARVEWEAPAAYVAGRPYRVEIALAAGAAGATVPAWLLGAAAFEKDGQPLGPRPAGELALPAGAELSLAFDLGPAIGETTAFTLGFAAPFAAQPVREIRTFQPAPADVDFMTAPLETLGQYSVLMETNRGAMLFEVWPDVAPNHVRNFLDLNHRGFYEGTIFHRVSPTFMIQGGDGAQRIADAPRWTGGNAVRRVNAEFNARKHVRGVLSAARSADPNSATSQFFVMVTAFPSLDNQYSAFGALIAGEDTLDRIAGAPGRPYSNDGTLRPDEPQQVLHTYVLQPH